MNKNEISKPLSSGNMSLSNSSPQDGEEKNFILCLLQHLAI